MVLAVYVGLLGLTYWGFNFLPKGYIPSQDKGYLLISVQLPDAASLKRTKKVVDQIDKICHETPGIDHTITIAGQSFTLGLRLQFRPVLHHAQAVRRAPRSEIIQHGDCGTWPNASPTKSPTRWPAFLGRRRLTASAWAAASSSSSRTRGTNDMRSSKTDGQFGRPSEKRSPPQGLNDDFHRKVAAEIR